MAYLYVWHAIFLWATCLVRDWFVRVRHNSFFCVTVIMTHFYVRNGSPVFVIWRSSMRDMSRDSFVCACVATKSDSNWEILADLFSPFKYAITCLYVRYDSFLYVSWRISVCDVTHLRMCFTSQVWRDSFLCATSHDSLLCASWRISVCDVTHLRVWHDSFLCATWLIFMRDMTRSCVHIRTHTHTHKHKHTHKHTHTHTHTCTRTHIHTSTHTYAHALIHTHTHIHI